MKPSQKNDLDEMIERFTLKCRSHGLKLTPQRIAVYRIMLNSKDHPSAETVFSKARKKFPAISFDTVNRTLLMLNEIGSAFIVEGSGDARRFDANNEPHQHFKCVKCKKIIDMFHEPFNNIKLPRNKIKNFKVLRATVYIEGICKSCMK